MDLTPDFASRENRLPLPDSPDTLSKPEQDERFRRLELATLIRFFDGMKYRFPCELSESSREVFWSQNGNLYRLKVFDHLRPGMQPYAKWVAGISVATAYCEIFPHRPIERGLCQRLGLAPSQKWSLLKNRLLRFGVLPDELLTFAPWLARLFIDPIREASLLFPAPAGLSFGDLATKHFAFTPRAAERERGCVRKLGSEIFGSQRYATTFKRGAF